MKVVCALAIALLATSGCSGDDTGGPSGEPTPDPGVDPSIDEPQPWPIVRSFEPDVWELDGLPVHSWIPDDVIGVVVALHPGGSDIDTVESLEWNELYNELAERKIGVVTTESVDRVSRGWQFTPAKPDNADVAFIVRILDELVATTALTPDHPVFPVGLSAGGAFAPTLAKGGSKAGWNFAALSVHASGAYYLAEGPAMWFSMENDQSIPPASVESHVDWQEREGLPVTYIPIAEQLVDPMRFTKSPGVTPEQSQDLFDDLVLNGLIDELGARLVAPENMKPALDAWKEHSDVRHRYFAVMQLKVLWASHVYSAEYSVEEANLFRDVALGR